MPMTTRRLAELAGVAPVTVSMALRDHPRIAAATRQRIKALAAEHNYRIDGRVTEMMRVIRRMKSPSPATCLALISLYDAAQPWTLPGKGHLSRLRDGIIGRARELGYRVEDFWLRAPGMSARRLRNILDARGIRGVICMGAPSLDMELPQPLLDLTVVTTGLSVASPVHRVQAHSAEDAALLLRELQARGYRRPGMVLSRDFDARTGHLASAMYLYEVRYKFGSSDIPLLFAEPVLDRQAFSAWYHTHQPDVVIVNSTAYFESARALLAVERLTVPKDVGFAAIECPAEGQTLSGVHWDNRILGQQAVALLVGRLEANDGDQLCIPRIELVAGTWFEGSTLRRRPGRT